MARARGERAPQDNHEEELGVLETKVVLVRVDSGRLAIWVVPREGGLPVMLWRTFCDKFLVTPIYGEAIF